MKMIRNGFFKYISIILILVAGVFCSACDMSWFDDLDDGIKAPLLTQFSFYSCLPGDTSGCEYKRVEKYFLLGTIATVKDFPYIDLCKCKPGYRIVGWKCFGTTKPASVMTDGSGLVQGVYVNFELYSFVAKWHLIEDVEYTVHHMFQDKDDETVYADVKQTTGKGQVDSYTKAQPLSEADFPDNYTYAQYRALQIDQQIILEDGSTEVYIYYEYLDAAYTVKHYLQNKDTGEFEFGETKTQYGKKGEYTEAVLLTPDDDGLDSHYEAQSVDEQIIKEDGTTIVAVYYKWKYKYTVKYLLESETEDDYSVEFYTDESKTCYYGEQTEAEDLSDEEWNYIKNNYSYYYREGFDLLDIVQQVPAVDDSTVIEVKYKRKLIHVTIYNEIVTNSETKLIKIDDSHSGRYKTSETVSIEAPVWDDAYEFSHWTSSNVGGETSMEGSSNPFTNIFYENVSYTAHWVPKDCTYNVTICSYFEDPLQEYSLYRDSTLEKTIQTKTTYVQARSMDISSYKINKTGYEYGYFYPYNLKMDYKNESYTYCIDIVYRLIRSTAKFDLNYDSKVEEYTVKYLQSLFSIPDTTLNPTRDGYSFLGWTLDGTNVITLPETFGYEDVTYIAKWQVIPINPGIVINPPDLDYSQKDIELPSADSIVDESTHTLNLSAASGYAQYIWIINADYIYTTTENHYSWDYSSLPAGVYDILVVVVDSSGNQYGDTVQIEIN